MENQLASDSAVAVYYTYFDRPLAREQWSNYIGQIPLGFQSKVVRFRRWQDQHASLFSYLLLRQALLNLGYGSDCLQHLKYDKYGRPTIAGEIDFNLSHSGEYVVCALLKGRQGGIDIEQIQPIDVSDFRDLMTLEEWLAITVPEVSYRKFYNYWTIKESVMKADGRGLAIPLQKVYFQGDSATVYNEKWFLKEIMISPNYVCHLATRWKEPEVILKAVNFY